MSMVSRGGALPASCEHDLRNLARRRVPGSYFNHIDVAASPHSENMGDTAAATNVFRELVPRDPNFAEARNNLGLVLMQAGDLHTAQTEFLNALRLKPSYAEAHYNLALAFHLDGKEAESQAEFEKAYAINPELRNLSRP